MEQALALRDAFPTGQRRSSEVALHWPVSQSCVGLLGVVVGSLILYESPHVWSLIGALALGLGSGVAALGISDLVGRGDHGERRLARVLRASRIFGYLMTLFLIACGAITALVAGALLGMAVMWGDWSPDVRYLVASALLVAVQAGGLMMMVRGVELPAVTLSPLLRWRFLTTVRQLTSIVVAVVVVGASAALALRSVEAVAVAMVGLAAVIVGWVRADRRTTDEAVRRLLEAADGLAAVLRPRIAQQALPPVGQGIDVGCHDVIAALDALDLAAYESLHGGLFQGRPRLLIDGEILTVLRACKVLLQDLPVDQVHPPLTGRAVQALACMEPGELERQLLIFASDLRRLVGLGPERLTAA